MAGRSRPQSRLNLLFSEIRARKRKSYDGKCVQGSVRPISTHGHFTGQDRVAKIHGRYGVQRKSDNLDTLSTTERFEAYHRSVGRRPGNKTVGMYSRPVAVSKHCGA